METHIDFQSAACLYPVLYLLLQTPDAILYLFDAFCAFPVQRFPTLSNALHFLSASSKVVGCWRSSLRALPLVDCPHVAYPAP